MKLNITPTQTKPRLCSRFLKYKRRNYCDKIPSENEKELELARIAKEASIDCPPTMCCQSGCSNCVFIVWAEALTKKMEKAGPEIAEKVLQQVDDPSMRAYLELELRVRAKRPRYASRFEPFKMLRNSRYRYPAVSVSKTGKNSRKFLADEISAQVHDQVCDQ
ncbi:Oxidoreductase-like domain-containing protein 1 [Eumeta japonica]|uniref:Oxidoreductase-like domain-containing protein 1 n=1 Tax=Eumeta variegata TaxID=151549 RepID=A0A4C1YR09_EUMVA|nr:Oxidoreductase-like domain-containing protein 1 [Eumeta japonica]